MARLIVPLVVLAALSMISPTLAQRSVGNGADATILPDPTSTCSVGYLIRNDDGTAEQGYAWQFGGIEPPYYGAFGEAYDLGPGTVACGAFWFSQVGYFNGMPMDCYVWEGGVTRRPEGVICVMPDVVPTNIPFWPECGQNDFHVGCDVTGEFTLGFWADFSQQAPQWYICVDENEPGGHPWTCIAPGIGEPTGWHHPEVVGDPWTECKSLFIAPFFAPRDPAGVEELPAGDGSPPPKTWGQIKALFGG